MLEHYLLDTLAWRSLSSRGRALYVEVKRRYNGSNNGMIPFSAREAGTALNASHHTGARVLQELQEHGFIAITEESSFDRKVKIAREYRLTEARNDRPGFEAPPTKEFLRWRPSENQNVSRTGEIDSRTGETKTRKREAASA